jgi:predicted acyltransferase
VVLLAAVIAAVYGLLVVSVQRVSLREISQAPGSPLNHPLRTDVLDTIGQLLILIVGVAALVMWLRDLQVRRKARRELDPFELGGLGLVALSLIPILIWLGMVLSTGLGAIDDSLHRLPTAYGWGGFGLLLLALGFALGYRELKPEVSNPVVQAAPDRPPWE